MSDTIHKCKTCTIGKNRHSVVDGEKIKKKDCIFFRKKIADRPDWMTCVIYDDEEVLDE